MSDIRKELGQHIRMLRNRQGMTQEDMADKCGLHWTYIGGLERGERNPTLTTMQRISTGLGVSLFDLLNRTSPAAQPGGLRDKKEGKLLRILRKRDEAALDLTTGILREILQYKDRAGSHRKN